MCHLCSLIEVNAYARCERETRDRLAKTPVYRTDGSENPEYMSVLLDLRLAIRCHGEAMVDFLAATRLGTLPRAPSNPAYLNTWPGVTQANVDAYQEWRRSG